MGYNNYDYSLFTQKIGTEILLVLVYVDDLLVTGSSLSLIKKVRLDLQTKFKMKDFGELKYFLGIEFSRSEKGIHMCQRKYSLELVFELGLSGSKPAITPLEFNHKLTSMEYDSIISENASENDQQQPTTSVNDRQLEDKGCYQRIVGRLLYLTMTRPDLAFVVQILKSRKSVTGYAVKFGDALVSWKSKNQETVSRSSPEAEFRSMASTVAEITWLTGLFFRVRNNCCNTSSVVL
ncbi:uncharacterized mitochondrial protein AtMg00810-like [Lycium barbarum]|uniref:uncharacterized mitochondrial protein AtMg00810-like n=1 Tax=Lycium barbarum TaxID=112863 RepID=UPI00293E106B|nr:uncharacterized mitochondrial protein AtMg00810-like [Lycium barbarum]